MNRLPLAKRAQIIGMLVEGNSLRATSRMADVSFNTVTKLLVDVAAACERFQDATLRNIKAQHVQCDEVWAFVYAKAKNVPEEKRGTFGIGDVWTWTALDSESKLIISYAVGRRDGATAHVHAGCSGAAEHARPALHGRAPRLLGGRRGRLWQRDRLRDAGQDLRGRFWQGPGDALLAREVHGRRDAADHGRSRHVNGLKHRTWSG